MYENRQRNFSPVKVGDELDVKIEAVGAKGDGIAKKEGFVIFVPGVKEGDEVRVRITKVLSKVSFAEVIGEAQEAPKEGKKSKYSEPKQKEEEPSAEEYSDVVSKEESSGPIEDTEDFGEDL